MTSDRKPMSEEEWREFCSSTLHGPPPHATLMRIYATVDDRAARLATAERERDEARLCLREACLRVAREALDDRGTFASDAALDRNARAVVARILGPEAEMSDQFEDKCRLATADALRARLAGAERDINRMLDAAHGLANAVGEQWSENDVNEACEVMSAVTRRELFGYDARTVPVPVGPDGGGDD